ncbi:MAG: hypothetical protein RL660_593 [Bacteroidota bacterium]|jgi:uncharacterized repeat protein (TIGR03803 family)
MVFSTLKSKICYAVVAFVFMLSVVFSMQTYAQSSLLVGNALEGGIEFGTFLQYQPGATSFSNSAQLQGTPGGTPTYSLPVLYNNKLYGTTQEGGANGLGIIYSYDLSSGTYAVLHNFSSVTGAGCLTSLTLASNNKFYGTTNPEQSPGVHRGSIFEFDPSTNTFANKYNFLQTDGFRPSGQMIEHAGKLYVLGTSGGGTGVTNSGGSIIEYTLGATSIVVKYRFTGSGVTWPNGRNPQGTLCKVNNKFYGVTYTGSTSNLGCVFEYLPGATSVTVRANFSATTFQRPFVSLMQASNGLLYGITQTGGDSTLGAIFTFDTVSFALTKRFSFSYTYGRAPFAPLFKAANNMLYSTTASGGTNDQGVIFQLDPTTHVHTVLHNAADAVGQGSQSAMGQLPNGNLYSTFNSGSGAGKGALFEFTTGTNVVNTLVQFALASNGSKPSGRLLLAANNRFYGLTQFGGSKNRGTIVRYDVATNTYTKVADFLDTNGAYPRGALVQAPNGKLYGVAQAGGTGSAASCAGGCGVLFEFDTTTNTLIKKRDFGGLIGDIPLGQLVYDSGTKLFGTTISSAGNGGADFGGVIYEYNYSTNTHTRRVQLTSANGDYPQCGMIKASNNLMYGVTSAGGNATAQAGVLYEFNPTTFAYTKKIEFLGASNGANPTGELMQATTGTIFGTTENGGANGFGTVFKYNIGTNTLTKLFDFTSTSGRNPTGKLVQAQDGHLYGMCRAGGSNGFGTLYKVDTTTGAVTTMINLQVAQGRNPIYTGLTEITIPCALPSTPTITASINPICTTGGTSTLTIAGSLNAATNWTWYAGSCNSTAIGTGTSITVTPSATTTYYARGTGGCVVTSNCGSITLTKGNPSATSTSITSCSTYVWTNGTSYNTSGTYTHTWTNQSGCDSIATLVFTKLPPINITVNDTAYLSYTLPWGTTVSASGTYTNTYILSSGCDSISTHNVYVHGGIKLAPRALLGACYDASTLACRDSLRTKNLVPLTQPYGSGSYGTLVHAGSEATTSAALGVAGANAIIDWVLIEFRSASNPSLVLATRAALLQSDGDIVEVDGASDVEVGIVPGNYYVSVHHRNHLPVMTATALALSGTSTAIDFTSTATSNFLHTDYRSNGSFAAQSTVGAKRMLYAGNCHIGNSSSKTLLTYNATSNSDRVALLQATTSISSGNIYSVFDCDMNGNVQFNGLAPDRLVILRSVAQNQARVLHAQLP